MFLHRGHVRECALMPLRACRAIGGGAGWVASSGSSQARLLCGAVRLGLIAIVVREYDAALSFFVDGLGFELAEELMTGIPSGG